MTEYIKAISTVDVVLLTLKDHKLHVVLHQRMAEPFAGAYALPGGYVHTQTDVDSRAAAWRVLEAKTGIRAPYLEQLYTFSGPDRDPRGWSFSVVYFALVPYEMLMDRMSDSVQVFPVDQVATLAFDHNEILSFAVKRVRDKTAYSSLPGYLLPAEFTIPELQAVYEGLLGEERESKAFRNMLEKTDFIEKIPNKFRSGGKQRPAQLYRLKRPTGLVLFEKSV